MKQNDGKEIEGIFQTAVKGEGLSIYRLYDTKSAGKFLPAQPADYMGGVAGVATLIECKSSDHHKSFKDCALKDYISSVQFGHMKRWRVNGNVGVYIFKSLLADEIEVWDADTVLKAYQSGWSKNPRPVVCTKKTLIKEFTILVLRQANG